MKTKKHTNSCGFSALQFLIILFFLSVLVAGISLILQTQLHITAKASKENKMHTEIQKIEDLLITDLKNDPTPQSDSLQDAFWQWNGTTVNNYTISISSLSSKLNSNFARKNLFQNTSLSNLILPQETPTTLQQYREENGLLTTYSDFSTFFTEKNFNHYFSCYSWANVNLVDEFTSRKLVCSLTNSKTIGELFFNKMQDLLISQEMLSTSAMLRDFCGEYSDTLIPYITTEPQMNIHFVDPLLLEEIVAYPAYKVKNPHLKCQKLEAMREIQELKQADIITVLEITKTNRLYYYFGCITWFWQIKIANSTSECTIIICRYPKEGLLNDELLTENKPQFYLLEKKYSKI